MTEYTVGANGDFKTLAAAAKVARPGDTIVVEAGVYSEPLRPPAGTTWIAAPGAVIDGGWNGKKMTGADATAVAVLVNKPDVTVRGFEIRNVAGKGVALAEGGDRFLMENCEIHHTVNGGLSANGTGTPIDGITIRGCHVHDIALSGIWYEVPVNGCFLFKSCHDVLVEDTLIERGYGEGIAAGSRSIGVTFRRVTVRDMRHLLMYVANRAQNVLVEDCALYQQGLAEFTQGDGDVGAALVVGDEESGAKDDRWQHAENITVRRCVVWNAGKLFEVRNQKKMGSGGGQDGYNTTVQNLTVSRCTFVAGPHTTDSVVVTDNPWGDGNVAGCFEANVFVLDQMDAGRPVFRSSAPGVRFTGNAVSGRPLGLPGDNIHIDAAALVAPFATPFAVDNVRPRPGGVVALGRLGALDAVDAPPDEPPDEPEPPLPAAPVDWPALLALVAEVDAHLATTILAAADTNRALLALKAKIVESKAA